jgi:hypothetical protein
MLYVLRQEPSPKLFGSCGDEVVDGVDTSMGFKKPLS